MVEEQDAFPPVVLTSWMDPVARRLDGVAEIDRGRR
jgi:hypothetical protein